MQAKYHPSDTTEIVKSELKFDLQAHYISAFNRRGTPSRYLRDEIRLSPNADIEVLARDERWRIIDGRRKYLIWNERGIITVYEQMFDIEDQYVNDLNRGGHVSENLLVRCNPQIRNQRNQISERARIQVVSLNEMWRITDNRQNYHYLIWKETNNSTLTVYNRMFDIQYRYAGALNRGGALSKGLQNEIALFQNADIQVVSRNNKWLITDGKDRYLVRKEQNNLNVYKRPTIENCALEYSYFLEINNNVRSGKWEIEFPRYIQPPESSLITELKQRQTEQLLQFAQQGIKLYCVDATVDWRLVVGLGSEHVQETHMTFHHIYGIPYIPGSAVKGVLRHWWLSRDFSDNKGKINENKALKDADFLKVFGSQEQRGKVQFLDAYPIGSVQFAIDIMNPHYSDYYGKKAPPTDYQDPIPINFLTVKETTFRFVFLAKGQDPLDKLKVRFEKALEIKGVGAKTAVGYGYFDKDKFTEQTDVITDELKRRQEAIEKEREEKRIANLSPIEQLAEELNRLTDKPVDENRAVQIYNNELPSLEGDDKHKIAQALKTYWQRINKWDGGSDKQRRKVMDVKSILGES